MLCARSDVCAPYSDDFGQLELQKYVVVWPWFWCIPGSVRLMNFENSESCWQGMHAGIWTLASMWPGKELRNSRLSDMTFSASHFIWPGPYCMSVMTVKQIFFLVRVLESDWRMIDPDHADMSWEVMQVPPASTHISHVARTAKLEPNMMLW